MHASEHVHLTRERLSQLLLELRRSSGLSGGEVSRRAGMSQSKLSKIENGLLLPWPADVWRLAAALSASAGDAAELKGLVELVRADAASKRVVLHRGGERHQVIVERAIARARQVHAVAVSVVPSVLRAPAYDDSARGTAALAVPSAAATTASCRRNLLEDPKRQGTVLLFEAALRSPLASVVAMLEQVDRLVAHAARPNLKIGIIPLHTVLNTTIPCGFEIYDRHMAVVHILNGTLVMTDPTDLKSYQDNFRALRRCAIFGADADELLRAIVEDYKADLSDRRTAGPASRNARRRDQRP